MMPTYEFDYMTDHELTEKISLLEHSIEEIERGITERADSPTEAEAKLLADMRDEIDAIKHEQYRRAFHRGPVTDPAAVAATRLAFSALLTAAERYLEWTEFSATDHEGLKEWHRLNDAIKAAKAALGE
jgi:hypothetical protein